MGFTKLDEDILKSSIMAADSDTFKVWITLLAACREDGIARLSSLYLSAVCRIELEKVESAIAFLESADEHSRTKENDGRRIKRVEGGFLILNYAKYRARTHSSSREAERKRKYRAEKKKCPTNSRGKKDALGHVPKHPGRSASASASASVILDKVKGEFINIPMNKLRLWSEAYPAVHIDRQLKSCAAYFVANPEKRKKNWERTIVNWLKREQERGGDIGPGRRPEFNPNIGGRPPRKMTDEEFQGYKESAKKNIREAGINQGLSGFQLEAFISERIKAWEIEFRKRKG